MTLPDEILRTRLTNEISTCKRNLKVRLEVSDEDVVSFPLLLTVTLQQVPGPVLENDRVVYRYDHRFQVVIGRNYPFEKPLVIWQTPIFHPNIMMPEDGGHLCIRLLSEWGFNSTLLTFIKGVESLLVAPNGTSPFGTDSCTKAAFFINCGGHKPIPMAKSVQPKVVHK
jgi:ubiquitin-protein ligase